ncbi:reverse transcriptase domain-containing protein [Tanacetum coccineum]
MVLATTPLVGFSGEIIWSLGQISLLVKIGDEEHSTSAWMNFMIVRRNNHVTEQQDRSIRMHNGFRARSVAACNQPNHRRKNLADMTGVPHHIAEHMLNICEGCLPVRQKKRGQAPERNKAIYEEVEKLLENVCGFQRLKQSMPQRWLSATENRLEGRVPLWVPFQMLPGCIQRIPSNKIAKEDEEKTAFITSQGIFCYSKMSFGLKNAGATYQRLVDKAFQKQIGQNLEVYVDDLVIKSCTEQEVIRDIEETFKTLREINMKLNPKKCTFGKGTFLGYKVNADGLKVCPDKVEAVLSLPSPKSVKEAIGAVLMTERDGKQMPIYFVSRALQGPEINYTSMEKLILALVSASKRLKRLLKWNFEPEEYDIHYRLRISVKGHILADFIVEHPEDDPQDTPMEDEEALPDPWIMFTNGSSCIDGSGAGLIIKNPKGMEFTHALRFRFDATNNEAEYEALIAGFRIAEQMGIKNLQANVDSRLVANQVNGTYIAKELGMIKYLEKVKALTSTFKEFSIKQIPRGENKKADALSKIASTSFAHLSKQVLV